MAYKDTVLADNPLAYFRMNEQGGSVVRDIQIGASLDLGSLDGGVVSFERDGLINDTDTAIHLNLSSARGVFPFAYSGPGSMEAWFLSDSIISNQAVMFTNFLNDNDWSFRLQAINFGGQLNLQINTTTGIVDIPATGIIFNDGGTYHFVITSDGSTVILYINGVERGSANNLNIIDSTSDVVSLGNEYEPQEITAFNGVMDEFAVYNYTLTESQVINHYNAGINPPVIIFTYPDIVKARAPLAYWRLGDTDATNLVDEIAGRDGAEVGTITTGVTGLIVGDNDTAVDLSENNYISVPDAEVFSFVNQNGDLPFTLEAWVNLELLSSEPIITKTGDPNALANEWALQVLSDGSVGFVVYTGTASNFNNAVTQPGLVIASNTFHIVATFNAVKDSQLIYINGVSRPLTFSDLGNYQGMINTISPVLLGTRHPTLGGASKFLTGTLDEVAIYNRQLSPTEIASNYNTGITPPTSGGQQGGLFASIINVRSV